MASKMRFLACTLLPLVFAIVDPANGTEVYDQGTKNGEQGSRQFAYAVVSIGQPIMQFKVGTNDPDVSHYTNVIVPPGWSFKVVTGGVTQHFGQNTHNGYLPMHGWTTGTVACAYWYTNDAASAIEVFEFGFDHPWSPHDVGWLVRGRTIGSPVTAWMVRDEWFQPVGDGLGALHGPGYTGKLCHGEGSIGQLECRVPPFGGNNYCDKPLGGCQYAGVCKEPTVCLAVVIGPAVCGCDGQTYSNKCYANSHGVNVEYIGVCGSPSTPPYDRDSDGLPYGYDNCPLLSNPDQADADADFVGDVCDACANTILAAVVDSLGCPVAVPGDFDRDGDVDANDFDAFQVCATGPSGGPPAEGCNDKDIDKDSDIDQEDFGLFQRCLSGQDFPAGPQCQ